MSRMHEQLCGIVKSAGREAEAVVFSRHGAVQACAGRGANSKRLAQRRCVRVLASDDYITTRVQDANIR